MSLELKEVEVTRWFQREDFNPSSPQQILKYMDWKNLKGGKNKKSKTGNPSTDEKTLTRLAKKDPFFRLILDYRGIEKIESTYASGMQARLGKDDRIHANFLHKPSTMRLSCVDPNLQNIPNDEEEDSLAKEFRRCIVAAPGCLLVEADFGAIEAVQTGWFASDPAYMRLARMGIHSYLVSHKVGEPASLDWDDATLARHLACIKAKYKETQIYKGLKKTVHTTNYGGTPFQLHADSPHLFPTLKAAEEAQELYFSLCPKLKSWQSDMRTRAANNGYLGGNDHPFHFKQWFWDVMHWDTKSRRYVQGSDWNKVVAFYPQSTAAGVLYDACLRLTDSDSPFYVANMYLGKTPLRAFIHDSILAEVPERHLDEYVKRIKGAMEEPIKVQPNKPEWGLGPHLQIKADIAVGPNWGTMEKV